MYIQTFASTAVSVVDVSTVVEITQMLIRSDRHPSEDWEQRETKIGPNLGVQDSRKGLLVVRTTVCL